MFNTFFGTRRVKNLIKYSILRCAIVFTICAFCFLGCKSTIESNKKAKIENLEDLALEEAIEIEDPLIDDDEVYKEPEEIIAKKVIKNKTPKAKKEETLSTDLVKNYKTAAPKRKAKNPNRPILKFDQLEWDFGYINEGEVISHDYYFTNIGRTPAIISEASSSCGCTIPDYPKYPIRPGERSKINVVFDSKSRLLKQHKSITITANTDPNYTTLYLTGEVWRKPKKKDVALPYVPSIKEQLQNKDKAKEDLKKVNNQRTTTIPTKKMEVIPPKGIKTVQPKIKPSVQIIKQKNNTTKPN